VYHLRIARSRAARAVAAAVTGGGVLTAGSAALVLAGAGPAGGRTANPLTLMSRLAGMARPAYWRDWRDEIRS
jgi:hypothetical protein